MGTNGKLRKNIGGVADEEVSTLDTSISLGHPQL